MTPGDFQGYTSHGFRLNGGLKIMKKLSAGLLILTVSSSALAQSAGDTGAIWSGVAFSVAALVVLILGGVLFRRVGMRRKNDLAERTGLDLMTLRQKNLLTPEEMKMVSQAIARRMAEKESKERRGTGALSTSTLMHDPEVQRLQELAQAKRLAEAQAAAGGLPPTSQVQPGTETPASPSVEPVTASASPAPVPEEAENLDDVVLPLDVQQLVEAGLLTPEEVQNVKRRLKARND